MTDQSTFTILARLAGGNAVPNLVDTPSDVVTAANEEQHPAIKLQPPTLNYEHLLAEALTPSSTKQNTITD
jgi:hypothetical protein